MTVDRDREHATAFRDMESEISELARMAKATTIIVDLYMKEKRSSAADDVSAKQIVDQLEFWSDAADFMVHHLHAMAKDLLVNYDDRRKL